MTGEQTRGGREGQEEEETDGRHIKGQAIGTCPRHQKEAYGFGNEV